MFGSGIMPDRHTVILGVLLLAGLLWVAVKDYYIFQVLIGIFTVVAEWGIFVTAWNSRHIVRNAYLLFVGIAYLFVGLTDLMHILSYKGMGVFTGDPNPAAQLWIIARLPTVSRTCNRTAAPGQKTQNRCSFCLIRLGFGRVDSLRPLLAHSSRLLHRRNGTDRLRENE